MVENEMIPQNTGGGPSLKFLRNPSGVLLLVNFLMVMICWCILAAWRGNVSDIVADQLFNQTGFFLFCTVLPWLFYFVFFVILLLGCNEQYQNINYARWFFINSVLWAFLLFIASCVLAGQSNKDPCDAYQCERLKAATAFGFLTVITLALHAYFYYREWRSSNEPYERAGAI
ncbi:MARVEL domain-containing protein 1-like [Clytia hemisphaerica]|uniref:MARVEL domain-containing protein n=1 Tax=Clytia hemisphaerica TaxID=252671 RepID=A0A7M5V910_9CNID|eukprot:TCONS_00072990-protein